MYILVQQLKYKILIYFYKHKATYNKDGNLDQIASLHAHPFVCHPVFTYKTTAL